MSTTDKIMDKIITKAAESIYKEQNAKLKKGDTLRFENTSEPLIKKIKEIFIKYNYSMSIENGDIAFTKP